MSAEIGMSTASNSSSNQEFNSNTSSESASSPPRSLKPLRTWIPLLLLPGMAVARFIPDLIENGPSMIWMVSAFGPFLISGAILLWWIFASRASWKERLFGFLGFFGLLILVEAFVHPSMVGPLLTVMTVPMATCGFALTLIVLGSRLSTSRTWWALFIALILAGFSLLVKTDGVWGNFSFGMAWRWKTTSEDKLMASRKSVVEELKSDAIAASDLAKPEWPNFRGPNQDGAQHGCVFSDDWKSTPPKEQWRITVGPAWSSFIVSGKYLFTQEQRGQSEAVVCYEAKTGKQVWELENKSRFFESLGGLGPRATPTLADGYLYALGAEGWLQKIQASNGKLIWKKNIQELSERKAAPMWGFSASPLVNQGLVIVHAGGKPEHGILALDVESGDLRWSAKAGEQSYASVQAMNLLGKKFLVLLSEEGAHFYEPETGKILLDYEWKHMGYRALQPQVIEGDKLLIPTGMGTGTRLIQLTLDDGNLTAKEIWTSKDMKPDFNDLVVHQGYAYGFDNTVFACIDLKTGKKTWRGGRYDKGQAILLADSNLILVVSEKGELILLRANPEKMEELARISAMDAKSWNHPVVVDNRLYLRNSEEAVCYELPTK